MRPYKPDVSVVMSVYNGASHLRESIESILTQEGMDFEFIIINDGSTDESGSILSDYASNDDRIRIIQQKNAGLTRALIRGCKEARGKYIARQDAGDFSLPGRLKKLLDLIRTEDNILLVSSWALMFGPKNELLSEIKRPISPEEATELLLWHRTGPPGHGTVMFRKSAYEKVGGYREQFYFAQDSDLWLRLGEIGLIAYYPEFLYAFQYDVACISSAWRSIQRRLGQIAHESRVARLSNLDETAILLKAAQIRPPFSSLSSSDKARGPYFIASCLKTRCDRKARPYYWLAIKYRPWFIAAWYGLILSWFLGRHRRTTEFRPSTTSHPVAGNKWPARTD